MKLHRQGRFDQALERYTVILSNSRDDHRVLHLTGQAYLGRRLPGDLEIAIGYLRRAVLLDDTVAAYHNDLGSALWNRRELEAASRSFHRALELNPRFVEACFNLGNCYWLLGQLKSALDQYRLTATLDNNWMQAHYMQANCLYALGRPADALGCYDLVLSHPQLGNDARFGKAAALLKLGRWREGWPLFDARLVTKSLRVYQNSVRPEWRGEHEPNCTLLVYAEQGVGDLLMYARFLPMARSRVGKLLLVCDPAVHGVFARVACVDGLIDKSDVDQDLDRVEFDKRIAVMSLTRIFGIEVNSIPADFSFLKCDQTRVENWRSRLAGDSLNVGLAWAGNPAQKDDVFRSCPARVYSEFSGIVGVKFYSLQKGKAREQIGEIGIPGLIDAADELGDFDATASLISALDLVITVDTAVAHLAGSLDRPVWTLLWPGHCWRYLTGHGDTSWYPSMRLFLQPSHGDWVSVISEVREELESMARIGRTG